MSGLISTSQRLCRPSEGLSGTTHLLGESVKETATHTPFRAETLAPANDVYTC